MKKFLLLCLSTLLCSAHSWAYSFAVDNIYYNILDDGVTCEVIDDDTDLGMYGSHNYNSYSGEVVVPDIVNYDGTPYTVVGIGENAFRISSGMTSVTLPETITYIGSNAFYQCTGLTGTLSIPKNVTSIGTQAFYYCNLSGIDVDDENSYYCSENGILYTKDKTELIVCPSGLEVSTLEVANTVTTIDTYAFYKCEKIVEIILPDEITSLGSNAFRDCSNLEKVNIPKGITLLDSNLFYDCYSLKDITIPENITSIGSNAFAYCTSLTEVTIPESVTSLGNSSFRNCESLKEITIPGTIKSIPTYAFRECYGLEEVIICEGVTELVQYSFQDCTAIAEFTIPKTVTSIGMHAIGSSSADVIVNIYSLNPEPPTCAASAIEVTTRYCKLYVPEESISRYNEASIWKNLASVTEAYIAQTVETLEATDVTYKAATISGSVVVGSQNIKEQGFEYWLSDGVAQTIIMNDDMVCTLSGLEENTTYTYRAYAKNPASGTVYGEEMSFITAIFYEPTVETKEATEIEDVSAVLNGTVEQGSDPIATKGFIYWDGDPNVITTIIISDESEDLTYTLESLSPETTYTYRAFAITESGTTYGEDVEFTTLEDTTTGINGIHISLDDESVEGIYSTSGQKLNSTVKGINIIRYTDGTVKKIYVK